jgi:protein-export SecD/SecF family membrane protein
MQRGIKMKKKSKSSALLVLIIAVIGFLAFAGFKGFVLGGWEFKSFDKVITRGLDLQGGVSVLMEIQQDTVTQEELESAKEHIALRVNKLGVAETVVTTEGQKRIRVDVPGMTNSKEIVDSLSKSGNLTFKGPSGDEILTGKDVKKATAQMNQQQGGYEVGLELTDEGTKKFADATGKYIGQQIAIYLDDEMISNPRVQVQITDGRASITGSKSLEEAKTTAGLINSGALPLPVKAVTVSNVGAELGATAFPNSIKAGIIGVALVFLFMLLHYRLQGLMANIALTLYITLTLFAFVEVGVTLTLPGIAAFLLTIGVAVDANILIFERTKEELKKGYTIKAAVKKGAENALSSIVDSNVTTLIAALILYFIGSGSVKGFAITLMIGIIISLFTGLVITKLLVNLAVESGIINKASHFGANIKKGDEKHA